MRRYRREKIDEMIKSGTLYLKAVDDNEPEKEENKKGKPKKYKDIAMMILTAKQN